MSKMRRLEDEKDKNHVFEMEPSTLKTAMPDADGADVTNLDDDATSIISGDDTRDKWGSRFEFLLAIIGFTVGIGSIWRFPIQCAKNGGGAFLIPFFFFMITCGGPLYYIEVCIGQYSGKSAGAAFDFCPLFKGLGFLMVLISFDILWYYVTIMGWIQYYFVNSFSSTLPWADCGHWWNTEHCQVSDSRSLPGNLSSVQLSNESQMNLTGHSMNVTVTVSPAMEFWLHNVLRQSGSLEDMGSIQWHLALSNLIAWTLVVLSLVKGVKSLGKVVYVTATAPYILLTILLIRGLTLDGATDGVLWYITPDFNRLRDPQVWLDGAIQVFYSLGPTYGGVITMASHNRFHQTSVVETCICVASDAFTAFFAGLVVFSCLGFMAHDAGITVEEAAKASGPGLAFVAYPEAISRMPFPQLWAVLFFITLITVAFDSTFGMYETVTGAIIDCFPKIKGKWVYVVLVGVALLLYLLSLPLTMNLSDWYISSFALLFGSSLEAIMVCWIYGTDRFSKDIEMMTGRKSSVLLRFFWCVVMTGCLSIGFLITLSTYSEPYYGDGYVYKPYAISIGLIMSIIPMIPVAVVMVKELYQAKGNVVQRVQTLLKPSPGWQPYDDRAREICRVRPYVEETTFFRRVKKNILGDKETPWV